jgi:hypothetical protein
MTLCAPIFSPATYITRPSVQGVEVGQASSLLTCVITRVRIVYRSSAKTYRQHSSRRDRAVLLSACHFGPGVPPRTISPNPAKANTSNTATSGSAMKRTMANRHSMNTGQKCFSSRLNSAKQPIPRYGNPKAILSIRFDRGQKKWQCITGGPECGHERRGKSIRTT